MARSTAARLAAHQRRYRQLAGQLADIGLITAGSITRRYTRCGTPHCRCHAEPPQPHGPYGVPRRFRTPDPIESGPEWRMENARTAQEVYA